MASVIAASTLALAVSIPLPPSSPLTASNNARPRFNLGGPPSRRSSLIACNHRQSIEGNTTTIDNNLEQDLESSCTTHRASSIPRIIRTGSDSKSSTTSSSLPNFTSPATSYACRRSDSGSFSESGFSEPTSTTSGIAELSRATSCAHPECVMAPPCERMVSQNFFA